MNSPPQPLHHSDSPGPQPPLGAAFRQSRREALVILSGWVAAALWVIGFAWLQCYRRSPDPQAVFLGMPAWVFWGVAAPWVASNLFTFWFCLGFLKDEPAAEEEASDHAP